MADNHHGAGKTDQGVQEDFPRLDVQVVGRFIQNEEIERPAEEGRQDEPAPLPAREALHPLVHRVPLEEEGGAEVAQHADVGLGENVLHRFKDRLTRVKDVHGVLAEVAGGKRWRR